MSKPKKEVEDEKYYKDIHFLYEVITRLRKKEEVKNFLWDILTPSELRMIKRRWHIACELEDKSSSVRRIARRTETSTGTVLTIARRLDEGKGGLRKALEDTYRERNKIKKLKPGLGPRIKSFMDREY